MQENKPIEKLITCIKTHIEKVRSIKQQLKQPDTDKKKNIKEFLSFYQKELIPKLVQRSNRSNVFSDLLLWNLPKMILTLYKVEKQIKAIPQITIQVSFDNGDAIEETQQTVTLIGLLKMPKQFVFESLIPWLNQIGIEFQTIGNIKQSMKLHQVANLFQKLLKELPNADTNIPFEQYQSKIQSCLYSDVPNPKSRNVVKFGYRFLFLAKLKLRVKKANKHIQERRLRILQFIDGERKYISGLIDYIEYIKNPICNLKILTDIENKKLFSTIESILGFHKYLEQQLTARFEKYHKYQTYGDLIKKNIPFFKLYTDYIEYADAAQALLLKLQQTNEDVKNICNKFMMQKQKKASDELKQPTFRIARYGMIINQILKNTSNTHPDYSLLKQAQKEVAVNLTKINETVDSIARRTRLHQLQQQFGTEQRPIYTPQRNFIEQFHVKLISDDKMEPVFVFVFNDMIIIIDENRKILKQIVVDSKFYVRREQDNKTYRNMVKVHSDGFITFTAGNEDRHFAKAQAFYKVLKSISKNNFQIDRMVYVHVIGTEEINSSSFSKYTEYIAEIKFLGLRKFTRLRFSLMKAFVQKIQQFYKNDLGICLDEGLKDGWFSNYNSKTIEDRKRALQQILQKMLNHKIIQDNPAFILNELGIQPSFFKTLPMNDRKKNQIRQGYQQLNSPLLRVRSTEQKQVREAETILCATQIKLGRDSYHDPEYINKKVSESERFPIKIYTSVGQQPLVIKISDLYTVQDVCYEVSNILELKTNRDFRLFHEVGKKQLRVLDNDKKIIKLFSSIRKQQYSSSSISQIFSAVKNYLLPQTQPKLIFKKYYFLPKQIEHSQCKKDITRLRLVVYQIFSEIKDMKYNLSYEEYLLYLAILIYIQYDGQVPEQTQLSYVMRIIPDKIFKIKNQTEEYWLNQCRPHLLWLREEINKIIQHNNQKVKNKRIRPGSTIHFGHRHICSQLAIRKIRANSIYGSNLFYVQLSRQTYQKFEKEGKKPVYNMWLAIKVDSLMLMSPTSKDTILTVDLKDIQKLIVETEGIIFKLQSLALCEYTLNTYQSFEISELVKYYKCLNQTIEELENNKNLLAKTKVYKQELETYRSSYEKAERQTMAVENTRQQLVEALSLYN